MMTAVISYSLRCNLSSFSGVLLVTFFVFNVYKRFALLSLFTFLMLLLVLSEPFLNVL